MDFVLLVFYYYHHHHHLESSMAVNENIWCVCHKCVYTQLLYFELNCSHLYFLAHLAKGKVSFCHHLASVVH
jgi:hypothetical protein